MVGDRDSMGRARRLTIFHLSLVETSGRPPSMGFSQIAPSFIARTSARDYGSLQVLTCLRSLSGRSRDSRFDLLTEVVWKSLVCIAISLLLGASASAQTSSKELQTILRDAKRLKQQQEKPQSPSPRTAPPSAQSAISSRIVSHLRRSEGIAFPDAKDIVWDPEPVAMEEDPEPTPSIELPEKSYQRPGQCTENSSRVEVREPSADETRTFYDVLYLPQELVPEDPEDIFGYGVHLRPYGANQDESVDLHVRLDDIPCLPHRRRITARAVYNDRGENALRNYSADQSGRGMMHEWVQQKLKELKKRGR